MKKNLLLLFLSASSFIYSQSTIDLGLRAGMNLLPTSKDEVTGKQLYSGFNGGGVFVKHFTKHISLKAELNYTTKTKQFKYNETSSLFNTLGSLLGGLTGGFGGGTGGFGGISSGAIDTLTSSLSKYVNDTVYSYYRGINKFGFIELPLIVTYSIKQFDFGVGGYAALLVSAKSKTELTQKSDLLTLIQPAIDSLGFAANIVNGIIDGAYPGLKKPQITESSKKDGFIKVDYGFIADLTYHYLPHLFFNFRYQYGFPNYRIHPLKKPDNFSSFTFSFGYLFNLKNTGKSGKGFFQ